MSCKASLAALRLYGYFCDIVVMMLLSENKYDDDDDEFIEMSSRLDSLDCSLSAGYSKGTP